MKVKRFVLCLFMLTLIGGICFISCGNTSKAKAESDVAAETAEETFQSFLKKFTSSASFQYTRVKFPLKTPITLMTDDGNSEKTFPFTQEKWPLLDSETMKEERITQEEGGIYVSKFTLNEPKHKIFEAGYEESEVDLAVSWAKETGIMTGYADGEMHLDDPVTRRQLLLVAWRLAKLTGLAKED